jgi:hypothetical protein
MKILSRSILLFATLSILPSAAALAQYTSNPGNSGGPNVPVATPTYGLEVPPNPALTTGSRYSTGPNVPAYQNPTVRGATGMSIVKGDRSTISGDRRATVEQKTGSFTGDAD